MLQDLVEITVASSMLMFQISAQIKKCTLNQESAYKKQDLTCKWLRFLIGLSL